MCENTEKEKHNINVWSRQKTRREPVTTIIIKGTIYSIAGNCVSPCLILFFVTFS